MKSHHTTKWCIHKPESVLENETHRILRDSGIQSPNLSQKTWPNAWKQKKKTILNSGHCCPGRPQSENKENKKWDKYLDFTRELKMLWSMRMTVIPVVFGVLAMIPKVLVKRAGRIGNQRTSQDHPNYCIIEISQNTEKSPGGLRTLAVTQTPAKVHLLMLVWRTHKKE